MDYKREVLFFEYFFFNPLSYTELANTLQENLPTSTQQTIAANVYSGWLSSYLHKAQLFYQSQYRKHQDLTWLSFCQHYQIPDYENPSNLDLDYEWTDWKENYNLNNHYEEYQMVIKEITEFNGLSENLNSDFETNDMTPEEWITHERIDEIWFNKLIDNPPETVAKLRSLPYEKYLETSHWKKIRSAMIFLSAAICQAEECLKVGESWYGGNESDLHIHHLDYSNRGNERFKDLIVLCKRHHQIIHQKSST